MHLVHHHVLQLLVVNRPKENVRRKGLSRYSRSEEVFAGVVVAVTYEVLAQVVHPVPRKGGPIVELPIQHPGFAPEEFNELPHSHARGKAVGVHDDVRADADVIERHVLLVCNEAAHTLLPVPTAELVSYLRTACRPQEHLDKVSLLRVGRDQHLLYIGVCRAFERHGTVFVAPATGLGCAGSLGYHGNGLIDKDLLWGNVLSRAAYPVLVQHLVAPYCLPGVPISTWTHDAIVGLVCVALQGAGLLPVHDTASKASVQGRLVDHEGVLNVVPTVAHHRNGRILSSRNLVKLDQVYGPGLDKRDLRVAKQVEQGVDAVPLVVGDGANGLLAHGALVGVARRLVVIGEGHESCAHPKNGERLYLHVGGGVVDVGLVECDVAVVLLVNVQVLHQAHLHQLLKLHSPREHLHMLVCHLGASPIHDNVRPADAASIGRDVHTLLGVVGTDGDKLAHSPSPAQQPERSYEVPVVLDHP